MILIKSSFVLINLYVRLIDDTYILPYISLLLYETNEENIKTRHKKRPGGRFSFNIQFKEKKNNQAEKFFTLAVVLVLRLLAIKPNAANISNTVAGSGTLVGRLTLTTPSTTSFAHDIAQLKANCEAF